VVELILPQLRYRKALTDVYVLRDALAHNHLWELDYQSKWLGPMVLTEARMDASSGDRKYKSRVNLQTHRTKALRLSVLPSRVDRTDVLKVFRTVWRTLLELESSDRFICYVSHLHVRFRGKTILFSELEDHIQRAL
jgi:hypothetical protein